MTKEEMTIGGEKIMIFLRFDRTSTQTKTLEAGKECGKKDPQNQTNTTKRELITNHQQRGSGTGYHPMAILIEIAIECIENPIANRLNYNEL